MNCSGCQEGNELVRRDVSKSSAFVTSDVASPRKGYRAGARGKSEVIRCILLGQENESSMECEKDGGGVTWIHEEWSRGGREIYGTKSGRILKLKALRIETSGHSRSSSIECY